MQEQKEYYKEVDAYKLEIEEQHAAQEETKPKEKKTKKKGSERRKREVRVEASMEIEEEEKKTLYKAWMEIIIPDTTTLEQKQKEKEKEKKKKREPLQPVVQQPKQRPQGKARGGEGEENTHANKTTTKTTTTRKGKEPKQQQQQPKQQKQKKTKEAPTAAAVNDSVMMGAEEFGRLLAAMAAEGMDVSLATADAHNTSVNASVNMSMLNDTSVMMDPSQMDLLMRRMHDADQSLNMSVLLPPSDYPSARPSLPLAEHDEEVALLAAFK